MAPAPTVAAHTATPNPQDAAWAKIVQAGKKEGEVVFEDSSILSGDAGIAVTKVFMQSTGIQLVHIAGCSGTTYERMKTEKRTGQRVTDIAQIARMALEIARSDGLLGTMLDLAVFQEKSIWILNPLE